MASVSSLDQDMRNLRMSRYTPQAANEVRSWIENTLGERLPPGDLLEALKDGQVLCRLANLVLPPPGIKYKKSQMPFIQMENISHFLRACESPPLNMPAHDRFLTVDLFESKDPAQVLQCLSAFSRAANALQSSRFPTWIGPKKSAITNPQATGGFGASISSNGSSAPSRGRLNSNASQSSSSTFNAAPPAGSIRALSPVRTGGSNGSGITDSSRKSPQRPVSSWSKKADEGSTAPAWNIHQYGYMGGASQGNQGVSFGARRQITTTAPSVPGLAEKERRRKEEEAEKERLRIQAEEADYRRRADSQAEEERERIAEEQRWQEETRKAREEEKRRMEEQKRQWEEQERRWKMDEESRLREEREIQQRLQKDSQLKGALQDPRLRGQFLSQYQAETASSSNQRSALSPGSDEERVRELERQLEEAKERERQYQLERDQRLRQDRERGAPRDIKTPPRSKSPSPRRAPRPIDNDASWAPDERNFLRQQWKAQQATSSSQQASSSPQPPSFHASLAQRPAPAASPGVKQPAVPPAAFHEPAAPTPPPKSPRPLPNPSDYASPLSNSTPSSASRNDRFLSTTAAPTAPSSTSQPPVEPPSYTIPTSTPSISESAPRTPTTTTSSNPLRTSWSSKPQSLLEREMQRERERQREWEENQQRTAQTKRDAQEGTGGGQTWDVNQYGWMGGDSQNRNVGPGSGIGIGGRRQIIGPRPRP